MIELQPWETEMPKSSGWRDHLHDFLWVLLTIPLFLVMVVMYASADIAQQIDMFKWQLRTDYKYGYQGAWKGNPRKVEPYAWKEELKAKAMRKKG